MSFFWKDTYNTTIPTIDEQHKKLFELGSNLYYIVSLKDGMDHYDDIMRVLSELKDYTVYHFGYEEKLMERSGYKDLFNHRLEHQFFINKILEIEKQDIDEKQERIGMEIIVFIADWITNHILKSDHQYKNLFKEMKIQ